MSPRVNHRLFICLMTFVGLCCCVEIHFPKERIPIMKQTTWELNAVDNLGGHPTQVLGVPKLVEGKALEFAGQEDGLIIDVNPLAGMERFTLEVVFRPMPAAKRNSGLSICKRLAERTAS